MSAASEAQRICRIEKSSRGQQNAPGTRRWAWKIGRIFGIEIYMHATFVMLLGWVAFSHVAGGVGAISRGLALVIAVFGIVVLRELGHALVAKRFGIRTRDITLLPIGGVSVSNGCPRSRWRSCSSPWRVPRSTSSSQSSCSRFSRFWAPAPAPRMSAWSAAHF